MAKADLKKLKKSDLVALLTQLVEDTDTDTDTGTAEVEELTPKQAFDALVEDSPYTWNKGRVYLTGAVIESSARVLKTGAPEIVKAEVDGHTAAIGLFRTDKGSVAAQNLRKS